jgi:UDP-glucuronate 4-epimerase
LQSAAAGSKPDVIIHLAAQAGVRYSLDNPRAYVDSNLIGSFNVLEIARNLKPRHLLLASTSSVYGANTKLPFSEVDAADTPITLYAATKKAMEVMSHSYSHLWQLPTTCFRFFTVYGPWGRPDMALFKFAEAMENGRPIDVYGNGEMRRDFTYITDLVEAIVRLVGCVPQVGHPVDGGVDTLSPVAPWRAVNIAGAEPVSLLAFIAALENSLGKSTIRNMLPMQPGDMRVTHADNRLLHALTDYRPHVRFDQGISAFVQWYLEEYKQLARAAA